MESLQGMDRQIARMVVRIVLLMDATGQTAVVMVAGMVVVTDWIGDFA